MNDNYFMSLALREAQKAKEKGEIPVGVVIVYKNQVLSKAHNKREKQQSPLAHAEILAIQQASKKLKSWRLPYCHIYVTLEPCLMCLGAILSSRISRIIYGCKDQKGGSLHHFLPFIPPHLVPCKLKITPEVMQNSCSLILREFFKERRLKKAETINLRLNNKQL